MLNMDGSSYNKSINLLLLIIDIGRYRQKFKLKNVQIA